MKRVHSLNRGTNKSSQKSVWSEKFREMYEKYEKLPTKKKALKLLSEARR